ncbi:MAG: hypothetical protein ACOC8Q_00955 [Desulfosalsimonas sp.]
MSEKFINKEAFMKIAVMSDTHDNIWNVRRALEIVKDSKAEAIIALRRYYHSTDN